MLRSAPHLHIFPPQKSIFFFPVDNPIKPFILLRLHNKLTRKSSGLVLRPPRKFPGLSSSSSASAYHYLSADDFDVELGRLLSLLPEEMRRRISEHPELHDLIEVVMDLGRKPLARFPSGDFILWDHPITMEDLDHAISQVGDFAVDNRAGISRTLHRISAIRNRKGVIIGLTCRVGRALSGSANLLRDLVKDGASLLLIGPPGVGKTTIIRDIARMLADDYEKRVMIVDTSNEIGGDGDIAHAGIGNARRMQVPHADLQHKVLIEAVENHMPQVIVIDEIGTKLEAMAASTIAQRGIQLVATAHGVTIDNLVMNPALDMLVGGVQSVTLGDEEASRRGVQKTVQERKGPSTFSSAVEIISKTELRVHHSLEATVDAVLSGHHPTYQVRKIKAVEDEAEESSSYRDLLDGSAGGLLENNLLMKDDDLSDQDEILPELHSSNEENFCKDEDALCVFLYGVSEASMIQGMKQLKVNVAIEFTDNISEADGLLALQSKLKKNSRIQAAARSRGIPIYVIKTSTVGQLTKTIQAIITDHRDGSEYSESQAMMNESEKIDALEEARTAIEQVVIPKGEAVELLPRPSNLLLLQKDLIRKYKLKSERVGAEPHIRLRILPFQSIINGDEHPNNGLDEDDEVNEFFEPETNGSSYTVDRLPILPDN